MTTTVDVTTVMYHLVRDTEKTRFPHVKARRVDELKAQVTYMKKHYSFLSVSEFLAAVRDPAVARELPPKPALLTFDDGYLDHYDVAFPVLREHGIDGIFFVPAQPYWHGRMLAPNSIHAILSCCRDHDLLAERIDAVVEELQGLDGVLAPPAYREKWYRADYLNPAAQHYVKRMLQTGLPPANRKSMIDALFREWVSEDEASIVAEYYANGDQLKEMIAGGMSIQPHSVHHEWMTHLPREQMVDETVKSLDFMREIGGTSEDWIACYPFGGVNQMLADVCIEHGAVCGFTTESGLTRVGQDDRMYYARVDTDDLPHGPEIPN